MKYMKAIHTYITVYGEIVNTEFLYYEKNEDCLFPNLLKRIWVKIIVILLIIEEYIFGA